MVECIINSARRASLPARSLKYSKKWYIFMKWTVQFTHSAIKQINLLSEDVVLVLQVLMNDLQTKGPAPGRHWHNYGKLHGKKRNDKRHCHLIKGRPTYVCCWEVFEAEKLIEVYYVGTHEKAPY